MEFGAPFVINPGMTLMLEWRVLKWDTQPEVKCCTHLRGKLQLHNINPQYHKTHVGSVARRSAYFSQGFGPVQVTSFLCDGTETRLQDCPYTTQNSCTHSADAGATCVGKFNNYIDTLQAE